MMLRIGTFSRRGRVSVKALRHYEAIGLLKPAHVDGATGYRYYEPSQLDDLHRLMVLRALGLPLERIRVLLQDDPSPELMRHLLAERRATVARRIDAERAQLAAIEARIRHLEDAQPTYDIVLRDVPAALGDPVVQRGVVERLGGHDDDSAHGAAGHRGPSGRRSGAR